ncbi:MAG: hypothetical protein JJU30_12900 [Alkalimonas sp.]|nr:hypothetical protein [Alkalimonas sp.]
MESLFRYLAFALLSISQCLAATIGNTSFPEGSTVSVIGENLIINGLNTSIWTVKTNHSKDELSDLLRNKWENNSEHYSEKILGQETIINTVRKSLLKTARIIDDIDSGSLAIISISRTGKKNIKIMDSYTIPPLKGNLVLTTVEHIEPIGYARTKVIQSNNSLNFNFDFYLQYFTRNRWAEEIAMIDANEDAAVILLNKGNNSISLTFERNQFGTMIVTNEIWGKQ